MEEIYTEAIRDLEERKQNAISEHISNLPIKEFRIVFVIAILAVTFLVFSGKVDAKWLWRVLGGVGIGLIFLGFKEKNNNLFITMDEAKAMVLHNLYFRKRSGTNEFNGLEGEVFLNGFADHNDKNPNSNLWYYAIGWTNANSEGEIFDYIAKVYSKKQFARIKTLAVSVGEYIGEETEFEPGKSSGGPKEINYYFPKSDNPYRT